jgi:hypothetical protein
VISAWILAATAAACPVPHTFATAHEIQMQVSKMAKTVAPSRHRAVKPPTAPPIAYPASRNFIDTEIFGKMKLARIAPAPMSSDTEFLRRVTIDLAGRIPTTAEVDAFLADTRADKRDRLIDTLLGSDDYTDRWTLWFGDLVQNVYTAASVGQGVLNGRSFVRLSQENGPPQDTFDNGKTNDPGDVAVDYGWSLERDIRPEDLASTMYSALGIDYTTTRHDDPLNRGYEYVPSAKDGVYQPIDELFA